MIDFRPLEHIAYAALRIVSGALFAVHGMQKVLGVLTDKATQEVGSQIWIGGVIELVAGVLIALGLLTRPAAFIASGTMAVAYIQFHWKGAFDSNFFPSSNGGELAVVYCFVFLLFAMRGAGAAALDSLIGPKLPQR